MARPGPRSVRKYSDEFKLTAVRLSQRPGIQVRTVATSLAIHPVRVSRWRTDARDGRLTGRAPTAPRTPSLRELARLQQLERDYALLKEEHDLLKKAIRFCSARNARSSRSSPRSSTRRARRSARASA
jgi:transposase